MLQLNKPEEVWALHFECDARDADVVTRALQRIYSPSGEENYLLGIKLCLILDVPKLFNHNTKTKVK